MRKRIAVVGVGNILMGDEGVGVEVMRALEARVEGAKPGSAPGTGGRTAAGALKGSGAARESGLAEQTDFIDAGTGFFTMVSDLDDYESVFIIDAASGGGRPGSMYRLALDEGGGGGRGEENPGKAAAGSGSMRETAGPTGGRSEMRRAGPMSLHDFGVLESIAWERARGKLGGKVVLFGIEPLNIELRLGLSEPLQAAMGRYVESILREMEESVEIAGLEQP